MSFVENDCISVQVCIASSLVGSKIKACTTLDFSRIDWIIGSPNAAVFPVPVLARAIIFVSPVSNLGIAKSWIGEGVTNPLRSTAFKVYSSRPKSSKETASAFTSLSSTCSIFSLISLISDVVSKTSFCTVSKFSICELYSKTQFISINKKSSKNPQK